MKKKKTPLKYFLILLLILGYYFYENFYQEEETISQQRVQTVLKTEENNLEIYFLDVGQADCIYLHNQENNILIDAGNNEDGEKVVNYLKSLGVEHFQYVIGTHAHEDHIGGMDDIINNFEIDHFYMPDVITTTKTFEDVLDSLEANQLPLETPEIDSSFEVGELKFKVLSIGKEKKDLNDTSIVLKLNFRNTSYLFMGDATSKVEKEILEKDLQSDVLKVGHHGSQYSSTAQFLKKVSPLYAIIQVGKNNSYQHPKEVTLEKLEKLGTIIYRTDLDNTILLTSDGENIAFDHFETDTNGG